LYPDNIGIFAFDNATSHAVYAEDALIASRMNLNLVVKESLKMV